MTFRVGQKVVCVDADAWPGFSPITELVVGKIYTVAEYAIHPARPNVPCVRLREVRRGNFGGYSNHPFAARRFRPVVEIKTDISVFTAMLNTSKRGVDA